MVCGNATGGPTRRLNLLRCQSGIEQVMPQRWPRRSAKRCKRRGSRLRLAMRIWRSEFPASILTSSFRRPNALAWISSLTGARKWKLSRSHEPTNPGDPLRASVFVPARAENYYLRKIEAYRNSNTDKGRPRNEPLMLSYRNRATGDGAVTVHRRRSAFSAATE